MMFENVSGKKSGGTFNFGAAWLLAFLDGILSLQYCDQNMAQYDCLRLELHAIES